MKYINDKYYDVLTNTRIFKDSEILAKFLVNTSLNRSVLLTKTLDFHYFSYLFKNVYHECRKTKRRSMETIEANEILTTGRCIKSRNVNQPFLQHSVGAQSVSV